jgi:hypothetical protein
MSPATGDRVPRRRPTVAEVHAALSAPLRGVSTKDTPTLPIDDLLVFANLDRMTVAQFAEYWACNQQMARRALQRLQRHGVVGCLARAVHGRAARGKPAVLRRDLFFRTNLGGRVIAYHHGPGATAPRGARIVLDSAVVPKGGNASHGLAKHRAAMTAARDPHRQAIFDLALRHGWLHDRECFLQERLPYTLEVQGQVTVIIPDIAWLQGQIWRCIEIEGTEQRVRIQDHHARYAALARDLQRDDPALQVMLVVVFASQAFADRWLYLHEDSYARHLRPWYAFSWTVLDRALTASSEQEFWRLLIPVDHAAVRARQRRYYARRGEDFADD